MNAIKTNKGGVRFHITREMIRDYRRVPPEMRLAWLENASILSYQGLTPKRLRAWEKFRKGEL